MIRLLLDASHTGGAVSVHQTVLRNGVVGANPHLHTGSSELFYLISGTAELLTGDEVVTATMGDLVVVPPKTGHAFAAAPGCDAELLIVITPGIERFEFFRDLVRVQTGELERAEFMAGQSAYDTHPASSPAWTRVR